DAENGDRGDDGDEGLLAAGGEGAQRDPELEGDAQPPTTGARSARRALRPGGRDPARQRAARRGGGPAPPPPRSDSGSGLRLRPWIGSHPCRPPSGRMWGKRITSRMDGELVSTMARRSMPTPTPPAGGMPWPSART